MLPKHERVGSYRVGGLQIYICMLTRTMHHLPRYKNIYRHTVRYIFSTPRHIPTLAGREDYGVGDNMFLDHLEPIRTGQARFKIRWGGEPVGGWDVVIFTGGTLAGESLKWCLQFGGSSLKWCLTLGVPLLLPSLRVSGLVPIPSVYPKYIYPFTPDSPPPPSIYIYISSPSMIYICNTLP